MLTDGRTDDGRTDGRTTDARVTGILIAHLGAFGSGELKIADEGGPVLVSTHGKATKSFFFFLTFHVNNLLAVQSYKS